MRPATLPQPRRINFAAKWLGALVAVMAGVGPGWAQEPPISAPVPADTPLLLKTRPAVRLNLDPANVILSGQFPDGTEAQEVHFSQPVSGRYFCLETLSAQDGRAYAAAAELDLLDRTGQPLPRTGWKIAYVDSEEQERENGSAENALDGNPATYWHTQWGVAAPNHPHHLVVDLGKSQTITGIRYLPRPGNGMVGGRIKDYRLYVGDGLLAENGANKAMPPTGYLFAYFSSLGEPGLHLAYSLNGYRWLALSLAQVATTWAFSTSAMVGQRTFSIALRKQVLQKPPSLNWQTPRQGLGTGDEVWRPGLGSGVDLEGRLTCDGGLGE